jgi:hypothetical protein
VQADRLNEGIMSHLIGRTKSHYQQNSQNTGHPVTPRYHKTPTNYQTWLALHRVNAYMTYEIKEFQRSNKQPCIPTAFNTLQTFHSLHHPSPFFPTGQSYMHLIRKTKKGSQGELEQNLLIGLKPAHPRHYLEDSSPARVCSRPHPCQAG